MPARAQVGNLSFYTTEEQIYELFSRCTNPEEGGGIKRIIMGLDRNTKCTISLAARVSQPSHAPEQNSLWLLLRGVLYPR